MRKTDDVTILCDNIRFLRKRGSLSLREMANVTGVSLYMIRKLESGHLPARLDVNFLFRIQKVFGVKCKDLLADRLFKK